MTNADYQKRLEDILDKHAEYYIRQTMKFFQENGESPALSKNNQGDVEAKQALTALCRDVCGEVIGETETQAPWSLNNEGERYLKETARIAHYNKLRAKQAKTAQAILGQPQEDK